MNKSIINFYSILIMSIPHFSTAEDIIYKYKDYEAIDLGAIEVKGQILTPGDLTISEKERIIFKRDLLEKVNFDLEDKKDVYNLR